MATKSTEQIKTFRAVPKPIRAAEFFAGIGLVRLALEQVGVEVAFANDIDADKQRLYEHNFGPDHFQLGDIHEIDAATLPDCELFTASFPCNDLSIAGGRKGLSGQHSSAFWGLLRLLHELDERRPRAVLLENVPGFLTSRGGDDLLQALVALNDLGYVCDLLLVDAKHFAPQSRPRLFVVAKLGAEAHYPFGLTPTANRPPALVSFITGHAEVAWSLTPLPPPPKRAVDLSAIIEPLEADDPAWWNRERTEYFMNQLSERHRVVADRMIAEDHVSHGAAFRRVRKGRSMAELRVDGLAGCLRTPRGGSGRQILFQAGAGKYAVRLFTPRECARLQGVGDEYQIVGSSNQALFGFGDAVCVPAVKWLLEHALLPCLRSQIEEERNERPKSLARRRQGV